MTDRPDQSIRDLFAEAAALAPEARAAFLDSRCADNAELRRELESLLEYHESTTGFLSGSPLQDAGLAASASVGTLPAGTRIGRYTVVRLLGAGGMGLVYEATQDAPRRAVALKLMRPGLVSADLLRRFEREAQTLARLQHPGIAQVYEAGMERAAQSAMPYLAMELVPGQPLTTYAAGRPVREKLELFARLAEAVAHAHQRGVVHRDLKPANVLVDAGGQPKVLDFGIARLIEEAPRVTGSTRTGQVLGTLAYLSPEQAEGDPDRVDIRADVYALGVILYELLAGRLPLDMTKSSVHEAARLLRDVEPAPLGRADSTLRGDLETIAAKAMEKDPGRRYQSAADLAADVRRHLRHEPIQARPASQIYLLKKFVRRNRTPVAALIAVLAALGGGLAVAAWQAARAADERDRAREEARISEQVSQFMSDLLAAADPDQARGKDVTVREVLDRASEQLDPAKVERPEVRAKLHMTLGKTYSGLGDYAKAEKHCREALRINRELGPAAQDKALNAQAGLIDALRWQEKRPEAEQLARAGLAEARAMNPSNDYSFIQMITALSNILPENSDEARQLYEETITAVERAYGTESDDAARAWSNLGVWYLDNGRAAEGEPLFRRSLEVRRRVLGPDHPNTLISLSNVANSLINSDRAAQAVVLQRDLVEMSLKVLGPRHPTLARRVNNYAQALETAGDAEAAAALTKRHADLSRQPGGAPSSVTVTYLARLTGILTRAKRFDEAEIAARQAEQAAAALYAPDDDRLTQTWTLYFDLYEAWGKQEEFDKWRRKLRGTKWLPLDHPQAGDP
ncbi:MAG: protein kinase [Phycisphaerales bacterium]|nr:protein kinase [Phycisphaerales bacterium]